MSKTLTVKQRKFIKNKLSGMSGAAAAREAGYSPKVAGEMAHENLKKPHVREEFLKAMEKAGITDNKLSVVLKEGLEANRVVSARVIHSRPTSVDDPEQADERTDDFIEVPDHPTRHKFLETAIDVKGHKAPKKVEAEVTTPEDYLAMLDDEEDPGDEEREGTPSGQTDS